METINQIWEFIRSMNLWNWLQMITFLFLPFTVLSLYFKLYPRFKDWQAIRNKKTFIKRLKKREKRFKQIESGLNSPSYLIIIIFDKLIFVFVFFLISIVCFVASYGVYLNSIQEPSNDTLNSAQRLANFAFFLLVIAFFLLFNFHQFIYKFFNALSVAKETIKFINKGKKKGFIEQDDNQFIDFILSTNIFSSEEKYTLEDLGKDPVDKIIKAINDQAL